MHCQDARLLLSARLDGEVGSAQAKALEEHLAVCPQCRLEAAKLERVSALLVAARPIEPPPGFADRVLSRLGAARPQGHPMGAVALLLAGVAFLSALLLRNAVAVMILVLQWASSPELVSQGVDSMRQGVAVGIALFTSVLRLGMHLLTGIDATVVVLYAAMGLAATLLWLWLVRPFPSIGQTEP